MGSNWDTEKLISQTDVKNSSYGVRLPKRIVETYLAEYLNMDEKQSLSIGEAVDVNVMFKNDDDSKLMQLSYHNDGYYLRGAEFNNLDVGDKLQMRFHVGLALLEMQITKA